MKDLFSQLFAQARSASLAVKAGVALGLVGLALVASIGGWYATRPHYVVFQGDLSPEQLQRVASALSGAGVKFSYSQPPGPHVVYVEQSDLPTAFGAVADAGALADVETGILSSTSGGLADIFKGHDERQQLTRKREWQDMEQMLEHLDFVREARVRTFEQHGLGTGLAPERSCSVTLVLRPGARLDLSSKRTIAAQVRLGLGIDEEDLIVADQTGKTLFDGAKSMENGGSGEWEEWAREEDERLEREVNADLARVLGVRKADVTVRSQWDFDFESTVSSSSDPKVRTVASEATESSSAPVFSGSGGSGGPVGSASNVADPASFGITSAGEPSAVANNSSQMGESTETRTEKVYVPSQEVVQTVRRRPVRRRMSVSLMLDESLAERETAIADNVRAMVGYDAKRLDQMFVEVLPFAVVEPMDAEPEAATGVSPLIELLLTRGLEFAAGLGFLLVLFLSLRKSKKDQPKAEDEAPNGEGIDPDSVPGLLTPAGTRYSGGEAEEAVDPEVLALARVQELLENEPEKVGELLTAWVRGAES